MNLVKSVNISQFISQYRVIGLVVFFSMLFFLYCSSYCYAMEKNLTNLTSRAEKGDAKAQFELGLKYYKAKDYKLAVKWYQKAGEQGYTEAQFNLGVMYEQGKGVAQDYKLAIEWYRKAAEQDHIVAIDNLINLANQNNAEAQYNLGFMYENGLGLAKDYTLAFEWYSKAAKQDHIVAIDNPINLANQNNAEAQYNLGFMYENGLGLAKDYTLAFEWYSKAAKQGNKNAQTNLGWMYQNGYGVAKDYQLALEWYSKAAEQGGMLKQILVGCMKIAMALHKT